MKVTGAIADANASVWSTLYNQLLNMIPKNPIAAMADPANRSILAVIFFAILLGVFIIRVGGDRGKRLTELFEAGFERLDRSALRAAERLREHARKLGNACRLASGDIDEVCEGVRARGGVLHGSSVRVLALADQGEGRCRLGSD